MMELRLQLDLAQSIIRAKYLLSNLLELKYRMTQLSKELLLAVSKFDVKNKNCHSSDNPTAFCKDPDFGNNATSTTVFVTTNTPRIFHES